MKQEPCDTDTFKCDASQFVSHKFSLLADEEITSSPISTDKASSDFDSDKDLLEPDSKSKPLQEEPNLDNLEKLEPISESDNKKT